MIFYVWLLVGWTMRTSFDYDNNILTSDIFHLQDYAISTLSLFNWKYYVLTF